MGDMTYTAAKLMTTLATSDGKCMVLVNKVEDAINLEGDALRKACYGWM